MNSWSDRFALFICAGAVLYLLLASSVPTKSPLIKGSPLPSMNPQEPSISASAAFAPDLVTPGMESTVQGVEVYGSRRGGDVSTGVVQTRWYQPKPSFYMLLAGFPNGTRGKIYLELSTRTGLRRQNLSLDEDPNYWRLQRISLKDARNVISLRIVGVDTSTGSMGWVGFSQPFTIQSQDTLEVQKQLLLVILCVPASLVGFIGPGLILRARSTRAKSSVWLAVPGIVVMILFGLLAWKGPEVMSPIIISRFGLVTVALLTGFELARHPLTSITTRSERRVLGLLMLLIVLAVAKATYSLGPSGELYGGTLTRTLEVGERSDSRIPYEVVEIIGLRKNAYSKVANALFSPWNFSHRGPLAGMAASPIALAAGAQVPAVMLSEPWTLFDPEGFAAYRIAMIVLSGTSLLFVFALARLFLSDDWATFAFFVVAAAPFTIHELFFTWPKIPAAAFVLLGACFLKRSRPLFAGLAVGIGYLFHPSALLWVPFLLLAIPLLDPLRGLDRSVRIVTWAKRIGMTCVGLAFWLVVWRMINRGHFEQSGFFGYAHQAGLLPVTIGNWLWFRFLSATKTVVPLFVFLFYRTDPDLIPMGGTTQPWVQFVDQYWCTLPFACGFFFYFVLLRIAITAIRRARLWIVMIFLPAFLLFVAYFGAPNSGLMREGLHAWFLGFLVFCVIVWRRHLTDSRALWTFATAALAFRGIETLCVLVPFASWARGYLLQPPFTLSDFLCLVAMFFGSGYLVYYAIAQCRSLRYPVTHDLTHPGTTYTNAVHQ